MMPRIDTETVIGAKARCIRFVKEEKLRTRLLWHFVSRRGVAHGGRRIDKEEKLRIRLLWQNHSRSRESGVRSHVQALQALASYNTKYQLAKFKGCGIMLSTSISTSAESLSIARTRASWPSGFPHLQDVTMS